MDNQTGVDKILKLCDDWMNKVIQPNGSGVHGGSEHKYMLDQNIKFHDLTINEMQACCIGLTDRLHYRHKGIYIDRDQMIFLSWIGQIFCNSKFQQILNDDEIYGHLCDIIMPLILTKIDILFELPFDIDDSLIEIKEGYDPHLRKIFGRKWDILRYVSYPLLEAVARKFCASYINSDGIVVTQFSVLQQDGSSRTYIVGKRCSSLRDLLILFESSIAGTEFKYFLNKIKDTIIRITSEPEPFDTLYSWRNQTLHGNKFSGIAGNLLFNLSVLFLLELSRDEYENISKNAFKEYTENIDKTRGLNKIYYTPNLLKEWIAKEKLRQGKKTFRTPS
jgi:hypothetical protein